MKSVIAPLLAFARLAMPALGSFHLIHYSELIGPQDEPSFFSAAVHEMSCHDVINSHVALSTDADDPLPDDRYPWWTREFGASVCGVDMTFEQSGTGDFLVYRDGGGFEGYCRQGSGHIIDCFDIITSYEAQDDYFCDVPIC